MGLILEMGPYIRAIRPLFEKNKISVFELMGLILEIVLILERSYISTYMVHLGRGSK